MPRWVVMEQYSHGGELLTYGYALMRWKAKVHYYKRYKAAEGESPQRFCISISKGGQAFRTTKVSLL
ncbi:unnamed protein product [Calypogeia fissa]